MRKSTKRMLRDAIVAHLVSQDGGTDLDGVDVVAAMNGEELSTKHIRVTTDTSTPQNAGELNLGRWDITASITVATQIDDVDGDTHDDLAGLIEDYIMQGNKTLAAAYTVSGIQVDNVMMSDSLELVSESMRYTAFQLVCECYKA